MSPGGIAPDSSISRAMGATRCCANSWVMPCQRSCSEFSEKSIQSQDQCAERTKFAVDLSGAFSAHAFVLHELWRFPFVFATIHFSLIPKAPLPYRHSVP